MQYWQNNYFSELSQMDSIIIIIIIIIVWIFSIYSCSNLPVCFAKLSVYSVL